MRRSPRLHYPYFPGDPDPFIRPRAGFGVHPAPPMPAEPEAQNDVFASLARIAAAFSAIDDGAPQGVLPTKITTEPSQLYSMLAHRNGDPRDFGPDPLDHRRSVSDAPPQEIEPRPEPKPIPPEPGLPPKPPMRMPDARDMRPPAMEPDVLRPREPPGTPEDEFLYPRLKERLENEIKDLEAVLEKRRRQLEHRDRQKFGWAPNYESDLGAWEERGIWENEAHRRTKRFFPQGPY